ncbi:MBOAT, membrane-bound O-acyltransferase family-domain-containing protein [Aspergillus pseudonomiae]|uniref:MBOAT, membrane-bound O-acyltransferase family-domain-containing protein n=1 Tax=Aspergillus pseudonomiae TaxID=1506151 RepID=A0A5N7DT69_9EURO|nr:MBOAT, membrane-bound O-acyltransferase family-domain-containing protein [Aspergillus pseudonomiae]KAB8262655.1 MBOAT, membrane-bound O-acyltransferase family-domain-containing protein [Aspergillus pseudonomiae]KAE8409576.1 MBOAT, membrane-bound O-acyltransferase family-domain-containing protein [Aspergillus pseudonomiae]
MASILSWFRRLYSLDTLDTRFIVSSNTPLKAVAADTRSAPAKDARANAIASNAAPSKWRTPEFWVYYVIFLIAVPLMFKTVIEVSQESHPTYPTYSHLLSPGWIVGRKVDNSDAQYSSFRDNIPYLLALLVAHPLLRRVYERLVQQADAGSTQTKANATTAQGDARLARRVRFDFYFALVFIVALHGVSAIKVLGILYVNYKIAKSLPRQYVATITWTFNIAILFANELCTGYPFERIATMLVSSADSTGQDSPLVLWGRYLDSFGGIMPRWEVLFKVTILRQISFNMDYYWSLDYPASSPIEKKQTDPTALSERDRVNIPAEPSAFNGRNYLAYVLYSPLYLAGPILTFNDYISQQRFPPLSLTRSRVTRYAVRFLLTVLAMEFILHFIYAVAISQAHPDWSLYSPGQLSMLGFFNLHIIWLKLLIPWRFFRLWALVDGVDPPENMVRCVSNNYSAFAFWRAWHRSFNRWIVRYVYVPLGGGRGRARGDDNKSSSVIFAKARQIFNFLIVFTFVALWHDLNLRLLMWGWLITLFVLPEIIATLLFPAHKWRSRPNTYRVLCGVGAVGNILMMMIANLVGFALGLDGIQGLLSEMLGSYSGLVYLATACAALFVGVQVMFEIRQEELRAGINLKC